MKLSIRIAAAVLLLISSMSARDRSSARSMVVTKYGIVATSHVQASVAGAQILARGGSAVDAAIAANEIGRFRVHHELESWKLLGLLSDEIEKVPLRHEHQELAAPGHVAEIGHRDRRFAKARPQLMNLVMRHLEECVEQA